MELKAIGDIARTDVKVLAERWGAHGLRLSELAHGRDYRAVNPNEARKGISAFEGICGGIYADLAISRALGVPYDPRLPRHLESVLERIPDDQALDILAGAAGALVVALRAREEPELAGPAAKVAHACARHLIERAEPHDGAIAWKIANFEKPLTGMAHGSCGIAMALAEFERLLEEVSRDDRGQLVVRTYLTSETGKVYTMLAHAAGRFD